MTLVTWFLILLAVMMLIVFFPRYGLFTRIVDWRDLRRREQVEDALKHLLDREQQGRHASPESLAGILNLPAGDVMRIITRMESQNLIEHRGMQLHLTSEGERWAMHIVRAHRLWERYLADEARMPLANVHKEANRREHSLSPAQLNELDAQLGHPALDPHGDPIPTRDGQLVPLEGQPLTDWQTDRPARIIHLEDEPAIAFEQILAAGLRLGQTIRILESNQERYILSDGESEYRLAPAVAANVQVAPLPQEVGLPSEAIPLSKLKHDQRGEVIILDEAVQGFTRRRFLDLGLTPGTEIYPELKNFFGEPRAYRIRGTLIALRNDQAAQIWVMPKQIK